MILFRILNFKTRMQRCQIDFGRSFSHLLMTLFFFLLFFSCSRATKMDTSDDIDYKEIANQALGNGVKFIDNESGQWVLCFKESKDIGLKRLSYMVIAKTGEIMVPKSKASGNVSWISAELLKIDPIDRAPKTRGDEMSDDLSDNSYVLNVVTNQRVKEPKKKI